MNPSYEAANQMIMRYWEVDERALAKLNDPHSSMRAGTLEQLKADVAHGVPVMVFPALTPFAHPISSDAAREIARGRFVALAHAPTGPHTEALGPMISLDLLAIYRDSLRAGTIAEAMVGAARVVIGYDDARHVVILNDPSFGPAYDLAEADFDRMWAVAGRRYLAVHPAHLDSARARHAGAPAYRARSAAERAAEAYVFGYGLAATGRVDEAEARYRRGLEIEALDPGYRHLMLFELAILLTARKRIDEAIEMMRAATEAVPQNPRAWAFLSDLYLESFVPNHQRLAADAGRHAAELAEDERAKQDLARMLPSDFWIQYLSPVRGWGSR